MRDIRNFYEFVREERLFCATLFHLLSQKGPNLGSFLDLVNSRISEQNPGQDRIKADHLEDAQGYVEFTYLRDHWSSRGRGGEANKAKRAYIFKMLSKVESLGHYKSSVFQGSIGQFNAWFMGKRGLHVKDDIVYPGQWSVEALSNLYKSSEVTKKQFRDFCRFKWSFNIKPDMVILLADGSAICIEAKLESKEGQYPSSNTEAKIFDAIVDNPPGRVGQLELQQFMFSTLLQLPCSFVTITRDSKVQKDSTALNWNEVFQVMDRSASIKGVELLVDKNEPVREKHS